MGLYLETYPGALEPHRTPFQELGEPAEPCVFIYMTNRYEGRWSYLLPPGFEREHDPADHIAMGYTQLWIMEKLTALAPELHVREPREAHRLRFPSFEEGVAREEWTNLVHVLKEPASTVQANDHLGARRNLGDALRFARAAADQLHCRVVVARLREDWTWH
jgi:hypothetical protein